MTPQELDLLAAVLPFCERATLAFCLENRAKTETSWLSIWSAVGKTFQQCRQRIENLPAAKSTLKPSNAIRAKTGLPKIPACGWKQTGTQPESSETLKPKIQNSSNLRVACANAEAEAVFAAREILKFVRAGNRFRDCAVLVRNLEDYHKPLARAFRRYGIPVFPRPPRNRRASPAGRTDPQRAAHRRL